MMWRSLALAGALMVGTLAWGAWQQQQTPAANDGPLVARALTVVQEPDPFGRSVPVALGVLDNVGTRPLTDIVLSVTAYDADGTAIGGGPGLLTDACGAGVRPNYVLPAGDGERLRAVLELTPPDAVPARVEVSAAGVRARPSAVEARLTPADGIVELNADEVVRVEWLAPDRFRYAVGCHREVFTALAWYERTVGQRGPSTALEAHPNAPRVTDTFRQLTTLADPILYARSYLSFPPGDERRRGVYQNDINTLITVEPDGSFRRVLDDQRFREVLQDIHWLPEGRFIASYYGAYGQPVRWMIANVNGTAISPRAEFNPASVTMPGALPTGQRMILGGTFDGVTGYVLRFSAGATQELILAVAEVDLPGNNFPAPVVLPNDPDGNRVYITLARPGHNATQQAALVCVNRANNGSITAIADLPLQLDSSERAWITPNPDGTVLALHASGVHGGLWLVDLRRLPPCD